MIPYHFNDMEVFMSLLIALLLFLDFLSLKSYWQLSNRVNALEEDMIEMKKK